MIYTKKELEYYIKHDALANGRSSIKSRFFGDEIWKFIFSMRKLEYYSSFSGLKRVFWMPIIAIEKCKHHNLAIKCGFDIPLNIIGPGFSITHRGGVIISTGAKIGKNCRISQNVTIGATNHQEEAATIGDNVFIGCGVSIIGRISIANNVCIGAGAVVIRDILEESTTWGGNPARKISNNGSETNLDLNIVVKSKTR